MTGVFCAIDTPDVGRAQRLARDLKGHVHGLKLGLEFFLSQGQAGFKTIAAENVPLFLDLKLHDIPHTVASAISTLLPLKPSFLTLHVAGGPAMMRAAAKAAAEGGASRPKLLGVTVLTSLDSHDLSALGQDSKPAAQVSRLARLAKEEGLDGIVCSPEEVATLRRDLGSDFILMVPGIRPSWADAQDQKRIMTPGEAAHAGASYLVIGRPITGHSNPVEAADRIAAELRS